MMNAFWGLKSMMTGEDRGVFSHEQMQIAHHAVMVIDDFINTVKSIMHMTRTSEDLEPVRILLSRAYSVNQSIKLSIDITEKILAKRGPDLAKRPMKILKRMADPLPAVQMDKYNINKMVKHTCRHALDTMRREKVFDKLIGVEISIDMNLSTFEKELELASKNP